MEPIELNGKTFCSNCGLTIKEAEKVITAQPTITKIPTFNTPVTEPPEKPSTPPQPSSTVVQDAPVEPFNPQEVFAKVMADEPAAEEKPVNNLAAEMKTLNNELIGNDELVKDLAVEASKVTDKPIIETEKPDETATIEESKQIDKKPTPVVPEFPETEIRTLDLTNMPKATSPFDEKVKEVDALGASGILLDILNDEALAKEKKQEKEALEAAEGLIDQVKIDETAENDEPTGKKAKKSVKLKIDVLDGSPVNPIEHPEIEPAEDEDSPVTESPVEPIKTDVETETPKVDETITADQLGPEYESEPMPRLKDTKEGLAESEKEINQIAETTEDEESKITKDVEVLFSQAPIDENIFDDLPTVKSKKKKPSKLIKDAAKELEVEEEKLEPVETAETVESDAPEKTNQTTKHLTNYFQEVLKKDEPKKNKSKKKKTKEHKILYVILAISVIALIAIFGFIGYDYYRSKLGTASVVKETVQQEQDTTPRQPTEIPVGYTKVNSDYDANTKTYTVNYQFANDNNRKLIFSEKETNDGKTEIVNYLNETKQAYTSATTNSIEYTTIENGSIVWTKDGFFYKLEVVGDTYKDLVQKMAQSVE